MALQKPNIKSVLSVLFFFLAAACSQSTKEKPVVYDYSVLDKGEDSFVLSNASFDTIHIPTGVPLPVKWKKISPDSMAPPERIPVAKPPVVVPAHNNIQRAGKPHKVLLPDTLSTISPGKDGVPLPKVYAIQGKVVPVLHRPAVSALPMRKPPNTSYNIHVLDEEMGLSGNQVEAIIQDRRGHIWIATSYYGLNRFDGEKIVQYLPEDGLGVGVVHAILEDRQGYIWIGGFGALSRFDGNHFTHYELPVGVDVSNGVSCLMEDRQGYIWIGTYFGGVFRYDPRRQQNNFIHYTTENGLSHNNIQAIEEDKDGHIWIGTANGLNRLDYGDSGGSFTRYFQKEGLTRSVIWSLLEDSQGNLWIGTSYGVNCFDGKRFVQYTMEEGLSNHQVWHILEDSEGLLWFSTSGGLNKFDGQTFTHYTSKEGLPSNGTSHLMEDDLGRFWVSTRNKGIFLLDLKSFTFFGEDESIDLRRTARAILEDSQGNIWLGFRGKLVRYDGTHFTVFTQEDGLSVHSVNDIIEDRLGRIWVSGFGADYYDGNRFTNFGKEEGLTKGLIHCLLEDERGHIWFGTQEEGIFCYDGEEFWQYSEDEGFANNFVSTMIQDKEGVIWMGTVGGGISKYDGTHMTIYGPKEGLETGTIICSFRDDEQSLWFGGDGLWRLKNDHFELVVVEESTGRDFIASIYQDHQERVWLNTFTGIKLLVPNDHSPVDQESGKYFQTYHFDKTDGLQSIATNFDISWLAQQVGMSRVQLFRKIKALTGKSPSIFVRTIRLQKGKMLLQTTALSISEIAYDVGFSDPSFFSKTFREQFGMSPSELREK